MRTMKNILVYVLCLTAVNSELLSDIKLSDMTLPVELLEYDDTTPKPTPPPIIRNIADEDIPQFQEDCKRAIVRKQQNMRYFAHPREMVAKFVYPCESCYFSRVDTEPYASSIQGRMVGEHFFMNVTLNIKHYIAVCKCYIDESDKIMNHAFDKFKKEHYNASCTLFDTPHPDKFNADKVRACFDPKKPDPDRANPKIHMQISESDVDIAIQLKDHVVDYDTLYYPKVVNEILFKEFREAKSPKVSCSRNYKQDSYEAKACSCLKQSGFFDAFAGLLADHYLQCGKKEKAINGFRDAVSCRHVVDDYFDKPNWYWKVK